MANTNSYHWPEERDPLWPADQLEERIEFEGPETVSAVIMEPVQNAGGAFVPPEGYWQRVREICDKYGVLLISDEVSARGAGWASTSAATATATHRT